MVCLCGLSVLGLVLGILCLGVSLCNLFYVLFEIEIDNNSTVNSESEQFKNTRTYHPTISNECCVDEENTGSI